MIRTFLFSVCMLLVMPCAVAWPQLPAPSNARVESVGEQVRLNGIPMRTQRVLIKRQPEDVARHYRDALGPRHASERLPDRLILSQGRDEYFISVSIRPIEPGVTEALISVADSREAKKLAGRPLGFRLPVDSALLSDLESVDAGKRSRQLVLSNTHSIPSNLVALSRELAARGMRPDGPPLRQGTAEHVQIFKGDRREANLTLVHRAGETRIVMTMIEMP